jgi:flagellar basal body-associated protein FliL
MAAGEHPLLIDLILPPWRRFEIISHRTPGKVIAALRDATEQRRFFRMSFSDAREFEGMVDDDRFAISRVIRYRNSLRPLILGRVEAAPAGARIGIVMRPDWMALISIVLILAVAMTILVLTEIGVGAVHGRSAGLGFIAAVLAGSYLMISIPFGLGARRASAALRRLLRASEMIHAPDQEPAAGAYRRTYEAPLQVRAPYATQQMQHQSRIRRAFIAYLIVVSLIGFGAFAYFSVTYSSGAKSPNVSQSAALTNHGATVYVTPRQKFMVNLLQALMFGGVISAMLGGLVIDRMLGVPLFSNRTRRSI